MAMVLIFVKQVGGRRRGNAMGINLFFFFFFNSTLVKKSKEFQLRFMKIASFLGTRFTAPGGGVRSATTGQSFREISPRSDGT